MRRRYPGPQGAAWHGPCHVWVGTDSRPKPGLFLYWDEIDGRLMGFVLVGWGGNVTVPSHTGQWVAADQLRPA